MEKNPYRPGAAVQPAYLAGRDEAIRRFTKILHASPEIPACIRMTGLRGVGKSVLLVRMQEEAEASGWLVTRYELEPRHNSEGALAALLTGLAEKGVQRVSRIARLRQTSERAARALSWKLSVEDLTISLDPSLTTETSTLTESLLRVTEAAVDHGKQGYALLLDEAHSVSDETRAKRSEHPLSMLVAAVNALQAMGAPICLVLCGLPTLRTNLLRARTYTERMFRGEDVSSLTGELAAQAFSRPLDGGAITTTPDLVDAVISEVDGYPYFIQLWGAELWDAANDAGRSRMDRSLLDDMRGHILERLDRDFHEGRVASLTPAEQDLLLASAGCSYPPLKVADLRRHTNKDDPYVNVLMGRLVEAGVVYRVAKGQYRYTAPQFHEYLQRRVLPYM
ncbi:MAG: AAA family ATPase [Nocardioidaceae bacterium]